MSLFQKSVEKILSDTELYDCHKTRVLELISLKFEIDVSSRKLPNWDDLEYKDFTNELSKQKVRLSLSDESEWMQYFNGQKEKVQFLKSEMD